MEGKEEQIQLRRLKDLEKRAYLQNRYTFSDFLIPQVLSDFMTQKEVKTPGFYTENGGMELAERKMLRFGSLEELGYEESFPIVLLVMKPIMDKFAESLSHRDYLGALMNLGIERDKMGDLYIKGKDGYVFVEESLAPYIIDNLSKVRHTTVCVSYCENTVEEVKPERKSITILSASQRLDGIVSGLTGLSRAKTAQAILEKKIYINGIFCDNVSRNLKEGEILSIRGYGKYVFMRCGGVTKKGKIHLEFEKYI